LIPEIILSSTVRALPGYSIARHPPEIFIHAVLTNCKTAPAFPEKRGFFTAAVTVGRL